MEKFKEKIINFLFPSFCLNCQREGKVLCDDCFSLININTWQYCPFCQKPNRLINKWKCQNHKNFALDGLFSASPYQDPIIKKIIIKFKYEPFLKILSETLIQIIIAHFKLLGNERFFHSQKNSCFVPIPISKKKLRERGYNQSELLADGLAKYFNVPLLKNNLMKIKNTANQAELKKKQREENIKNAFLVLNREEIKGKTIFLVDDVFTTGSTIEEAAATLKIAGAKKVFGIVAAREGLQT